MSLVRTAFLRKQPDVDRLTVKVLPESFEGDFVKVVDVPVPAFRARKCRICFTRFTPDRKNVTWCGAECGYLVSQQELAKVERKSDRERKEALKSKGDLIAEAQVAFNAFCRERDRNTFCISCNVYLPAVLATPGGGVDCGHFRSRGSAPHLRFSEDNAHGQCKRCNRYLSGNVTEYRPRLIARIGIERVEALEADQEVRRYTPDELIAIKKLYQLKLKQLKGNDNGIQ